MTAGGREATGGPAPDRADFSAAAEAFTAAAERALSNGESARIGAGDLERAITAAVKLYAAKTEAEESPAPPVSAERVTPTEVVVIVTEMLRAVDVSLFDLAMWYRRGGS